MIEKLRFCDIACYKIKKIPHPKYCICIDPIRRFFLFINTYPNRKNPDGDMFIKPIRELTFLDHASYINTSHIERIYEINIEWFDPKGKLSEPLIEELSKKFLNNRSISKKRQKEFWAYLNNNLKMKLKKYQPKSISIPRIN
jgi:hypothetical protein